MSRPCPCGCGSFLEDDADWLDATIDERISRRECERETEEKRREKGDDWARDERLGRFYGVEVES